MKILLNMRRIYRERIKVNLFSITKKTISLIKWLIHYSGIQFIWHKFCPPKNSQKVPTGFIWVFSIYIAAYGLSFQRYENRSMEVYNSVERVNSQLMTNMKPYALSRIPSIQWQPCPVKPHILQPITVIKSLFGEYVQCEEQVSLLKDILIENRNLLRSVYLNYCDLRGTIFLNCSFEKSSLMYGKLDQAIFVKVDFKDTDLFNTKMNYAWFNNCDFKDANFSGANLTSTFFSECDLSKAKNLTIEQLLKCRSLYGSKLKPEWLEIIKKSHSKLLEWPDGITQDKLEIQIDRSFPSYFKKIFEEHTSD